MKKKRPRENRNTALPDSGSMGSDNAIPLAVI